MNTMQGVATGEVERTLDREVALVMSAVNLVATGGARSAIVAGLRLAEAAITVARPQAMERSLVLEALWGPDERTCDVRVRRPATE